MVLLEHNNLSSDAVLRRVSGYLQQENALTLAILSPDLVIVEASERFQAFQGEPSLEPVGRHVSELFWELVGSESGLQEVLEGKQDLFSLENINRATEDGSTVYVSIKAIPLVEREPNRGLLLFIQDTTLTSRLEQELVQDRNELRLIRNQLSRANEELRKLDRLKSLFLSIAAHDMRSPLTAMRGYTDLAIKSLSREGTAEPAEYLTIVVSLVDALNRLIGDFLDLDILEQGNLKIRPQACNLNPIVLGVADVMRSVAKRKDVQIETQLQDDLPLINADPDRLQQILFNLAGNAIKYTSVGDRIIIETRFDRDCVLLIVKDHGPGIPESDLPRLFDLYHRTAEARQSQTQGLGLGLFIVKSLVDLHHGKISAQSEVGKGTAFTVSIPVYRVETGGPE